MDLDTSPKEDRSLFLVEEHCNLHQDEVEEKGQGLEDEEKIMEETIQVCELTNPPSPIGVNNEEQQSPTLISKSADLSSPLMEIEGQEPQLHIESHFGEGCKKKSLADGTETLKHIEKEESSNYGDLLDCNSGEILRTDRESPDSNSHFKSHDSNFGNTDPELHQSGDETSESLSVNPQSDKSELDNEQITEANVGHDAEIKVDHTLGTMTTFNGGTLRESSILEFPSIVQGEELLPSADPQFSVPVDTSSPTIPVAVEKQMPPENDQRESAASSKHVTYSEGSMGALVHSSPTAEKQKSSPSPERQLSVPLKTSTDTQNSERQEPMHHENGVSKLASSSKRTPPEKNTISCKRASSHDRLSPSKRHKSPLGSVTCQDSHRKDYSPRRRESPRRRDRQTSRSPERRDSSGHRRGNNVLPRSRSPYSRDNYKRRGHNSPRRRSPPPSYNSHRRSPRRPWSPPRNRNTGVGRPGKNLFIAGFSYATTERDLEKKFSRFGRVRDVRIVRDKRSGDSRGFGFLSLETDEDADAAIRALDQTEWNGRIVLVEKTKTSAH